MNNARLLIPLGPAFVGAWFKAEGKIWVFCEKLLKLVDYSELQVKKLYLNVKFCHAFFVLFWCCDGFFQEFDQLCNLPVVQEELWNG